MFYGSNTILERSAYNAIVEDARSGTLKILMIAVERFKNERFRSQLDKMDVSLLVVDEAHCISEWGHNFRPEYLNLPIYQAAFSIEQTLLLTATATDRVIEDMCTKFDLARENVIVTGFYRDNLFLRVSSTHTSEKEDRLLRRIRERPDASTIVYVTLQKTAERVAAFLDGHGIDAQPYHAGMQTVEREQIQNQFMQEDLACVVATITFGMGIDKKDIRRVIHFDLPKSIENYSQEIGRSGRDGEPALCEVLANRDMLSVLENFIYGDTPERIMAAFNGKRKDFVSALMAHCETKKVWTTVDIQAMLGFLESDGCLSRELAGYFGEKLDIRTCGHCSHCTSGQAILEHTTTLEPLAAYDYTAISKAFSHAIGDSFSALNVTNFLCGIYTPAFSKMKIKRLPHFGILESYPFLEVRQWVMACIA
jgi:RecQ family ATP-dependent DNA helicase